MPIVSFRVTAEVHEKLLNLAKERDQTLTALMQETSERIVELTMKPSPVSHVREQIERLPPRKADPKVIGFAMDGTPLYADQGSRLKKEKK